MTTTMNFSDYVTDIKSAARKAQDVIEQTNEDMKHLQARQYSSNPEIAIIELIAALVGKNDSMLTYSMGKMDGASERIVVNSKIGSASNYLEGKMNNPTSTQDTTGLSTEVMAMGNDLSILKGMTSSDSSASDYNWRFDHSAGGEAMDSATRESLHENFTELRHLFDLSSGSPDNVPGDDGANAPFSAKGMTSFYQYQKDLGEPGDKNQSTEAAKTSTNCFQTIAETTQTTNGALTNDMKSYGSLSQTIEQTGAALGQMDVAVDKVAIQHAGSGG